MEAKNMCTMNYVSSASKSVKPTVVNMSFSIYVNDTDVTAAIHKLNDQRKKSRQQIFLKDSLIHDSFEQTNIEVTPQYKIVETTKEIDGEKKVIKESVFDHYTAYTNFSFQLKNDDTVLDDFTDILNMTIALKTKCDYSFNITDSERKELLEELTAQAIDNGIKSIKNILGKCQSTELDNRSLNITGIDTNYASGGGYRGAALAEKCIRKGEYDYEEIITTDLVQDIFNNKKIALSKTINIEIDLKTSRAI